MFQPIPKMAIRLLHIIWLLPLLCLINACNGDTDTPTEPTAPVEDTIPAVVQNPALDEATKRIQQNPDSAQAYIDRAIIHYKLTNNDAALADLDSALALDKYIPKIYLLQADLYFVKRDIVRCIKSLEAGAEALPENKEILLLLSRYYFFNHEHDKSIKTADNALKLDPGYAPAYYQKAMIFLEVKDTAKAISNLQTSVEQDPDFEEAYLLLGEIYSFKKNPLAIQYFRNAAKIDPRNNDTRYALALALQDHKKYNEALDEYRLMITESPQDEKAHYGMGWVYFQLDSTEKAKASFEIVIRIKPDYTDAYYMLGLIAESVGDIKNAEYYYDQTLRINALHTQALNGFNRLKEKRK